MMTKGSRILILIAALALGWVYVLPLWRITLEAPQYPEGLGMVIRIADIEGVKEHDLRNINNLNHYIGMKPIEPESIPELRIMPVVVGLLMALGLGVAALGRRRLLFVWVAGFLVVATAGLVDFRMWEYDYGHDLDEEHAIIKVPGMSYQPPLIGSRRILNFTAHSWPGAGGWIAIVVGLVGTGVALVELRRRPGRDPRGAVPLLPVVALLSVAGAAGCGEPEPRAIAFGADACERCLMAVADEGHATQAVSATGRSWVFDSVECLAAWLAEPPADVHSLWVTDFAAPPTLVPAETAFFLQSPTLASPMGMGLTAFARREDRDGAVQAFGGRPLSWPEVLELVRDAGAEAWPGHGGHESALEPPGGRALAVGPRGSHATIAAAVAAAAPHDTIYVDAGVYEEGPIVIDRPLTLLGRPGAILDGGGRHGLVEVTADSVTVRGLTLRRTGTSFVDDRAALKVEKASRCEIADNRIEDAFFGIYLANAGDCVVRDNVLVARGERESRTGNGIHLWYSTRITITGNRIEGHRDGIYFEFVEDSRVEDNVSRDNLRYGLHFMFSDRCDYRGNVFRSNGAGVAVMYTREVVMDGNDFDENRGGAAFGLLLKDITDSRITGNRFRRNSVGIHAEGANRLQVHGNEFLENGWALQVLANSEDSSFRRNNFFGNSFDVSTNSRRAYSTFSGNYWDRYRGYDLDRDGVGDVPFRPVRLFSLVVEQNEPALVLQRSFLVTLLDLAEQVLPLLTPANLADDRPSLTPIPTAWRRS